MRKGTIRRTTHETSIEVDLNLDGTGIYDVSTGIGFLDHMLEQLSRHSLIDLSVKTVGDLHIDQHHTTEDTGIAVGEALAQALGDKRGITRYGSAYAPMDETLTRCALDISGRPWLVFKADFGTPRLGSSSRLARCSSSTSSGCAAAPADPTRRPTRRPARSAQVCRKCEV